MSERDPGKSLIVLSTANARFSHTAFALRCLRANLGELEDKTELLEFTLEDRATDMVERILKRRPRIVGLGVYIWNSDLMVEVAHQLKQVAADVVVIAGGPEVGFDTERHPIYPEVDHVITGEAENLLLGLVRDILDQTPVPERIVSGPPPDLARLKLPYHLYTEQDIRHRVVYVETSRGCPFRCAFCLSALDAKVRRYPEDALLGALDELYRRGARRFKFIDRALHLGITPRLLDFFHEKRDPDLFLHFEMVPDRIPTPLLHRLFAFPHGAVQVEAGIQTLNEAVAARIGRKHNLELALSNLRMLKEKSGVHIHADLVVGLPGESFESIRAGFDRLFALGLHEIQVGILKRLHGAPITRFDEGWGMVYNRKPPYDILCNERIDFQTMQRFKRFAKVFDLVANRGHFKRTVPFLIGEGSPFDRFWHLSDWLRQTAGRTHAIALNRLASLLFRYATEVLGRAPADIANRLHADFGAAGRRSFPAEVAAHVTRRESVVDAPPGALPKRQARHRRGRSSEALDE